MRGNTTFKPPDYEFNHPTRGKIRAYEFASGNGNMKYVFYRDAQDRTWVGSVESAKPGLTPFGTKAAQINVGDLTTPAIEYPDQLPPHLRPNDERGHFIYAEVMRDGQPVKSDYVDATAYVYQIDVVREFRTSQGLPVPSQFPPPPAAR